METGILALNIGGKEFECAYEANPGVPSDGLNPPEGPEFALTGVVLVCSAFVGHDPVRIDLLEVFDAVGALTRIENVASRKWERERA